MSTTAWLRIGLRWSVRLVLCGVLSLTGFAVTVLIVLPRASHGVALTVLTGSMTPKIPVGSVVIDRPVDPGTLQVGDIATYQKAPGQSEYITHRIVAIDTSTSPVSFTFKGDANRGPDIDPVPATAIRGKVWFHAAYLGAIRDSLQSHGSRGIALVLAILGLTGFAVQQFVSARRGRATRLVLRFAPDAFDEATPGAIARVFGADCAIDEVTGIATMTLTAAPGRCATIGELLAPHALPDGDGESAAPAKRSRRRPVGAHARS
jgi:signal peptidase I